MAILYNDKMNGRMVLSHQIYLEESLQLPEREELFLLSNSVFFIVNYIFFRFFVEHFLFAEQCWQIWSIFTGSGFDL
jgi:hypothetical protein